MRSTSRFSKMTAMSLMVMAMAAIIVATSMAGPARGQSLTTNKCNFVDLPESLPTSLSSVAYLGFDGEFHMHGEFFANFTNHEHNTFFTLTEQSYFRVSVAPQEDWDVDLFLYSQDSQAPIASAIAFYGEELITRTLPSGDYRLRFNFLIFGAAGSTPGAKCKTLTLEWAIVPKTVAKARADGFKCPTKESFPELPSPLVVNGKYTYNSTQIYNAQTDESSRPPNKNIRLFKDYNFTIAPSSSTNTVSFWRVDAVLGYDFLTGGSLGMMLDLNTTTRETDLSCLTRTHGILYPATDQCTVAADVRMNEAVISWTLQPGDYTLWLYELYNQTDKSVLGCTPFTFSLQFTPVEENENLLNCKATRLPTTLNVPGLLGDRGVLEFAEDVWIDLAHPSHTIRFDLTTLSNLRLYTEEHRIDIDVRLSNASGTLAQSLTFGQEEAIIATLAPGSYNLSIQYFDARNPQFCETFFMMLSIAPVSLTPSNFCANSNNLAVAPNLGQFFSTPQFAMVSVPTASYVYPWPGDTRTTRTIYSFSFTPATQSYLRILIGTDFLLSDMKLVVSWTDNNRLREVIGDHSHGKISVGLEVPTSNITITIMTGYATQHDIKLPNFPSCLKYTFQLDFLPLGTPEAQNFCGDFVSLPFAINTTQALGLKEIHLSDRFLIPHQSASFGLITEKASFTVKEQSQFRLFCEAPDADNFVDVDFHLSEDDQIVAHAISTRQEEEITYTLKPGKNYSITVYHFLSLTSQSRCMSYSLELSISPFDADVHPCNGQQDKLPPASLISTPNGKYFESVDTYSFTQTDKPLRHKLNFILDQSYFLRAIISYDFLWNNLNLRLIAHPSGNQLGYGKTAYNRNDIDVVALVAGNYTLEIYEPSLINNAARGCVKFNLLVALLPVVPAGDSGVLTQCLDSPLPQNVTGLTGVSTFSANSLHWQRDVLANVETKEEYMSFVLNSESIFRFYVPHHDILDVDLYLYKGTPANPGGLQEQTSPKTTFGEESMAYKLPPGAYFLKTKLYPQPRVSLPSPSDCGFFPAEAAIVPVQTLASNPMVGKNCSNIPIPKTLTPNNLTTGVYRYTRLPNTRFQERISFNVTSNSRLELDLRYDFASSAVSAELTRQQTSTTSKEIIYSKIGTNHAFLHAVLIPGRYDLLIKDPVSDFKISELKCLTFEMSYKFDTVVAPDPDTDGCDTSQLIPSNLDDAEGGSVPYGGPQASDGSIKIFAEHILMPKQRFTSQDIPFINPRDSYMRIFAQSDPTNDVDFYIYSNVNKTAGSFIGIANSMQEIESGLFFLPASTQKYLLEVKYFKVDTAKACNYFRFELASQPRDKVLQDLLCPINIAAPPADITFASGNDVDIHRDDYVFNAALINSTDRTFRYSIHLNVRDKTTLSAEIGFNFLANDFRLVIRNSERVVLHNSKVRGTANSNSYINFYHTLRAELQPGTYYLDIEENLLKKDLKLNSTMCHRFSLSVTGISESTPHVLSVSPPGGTDLDPTKDLNVQITFSDPVSYPSDVAAYFSAHPIPDNGAPGLALRYIPDSDLKRADGEFTWVRPSRVRFSDTTRRTLLVVFASKAFTTNANFELVFNLTEFNTSSGEHFANAVQSGFTYEMISDRCGDHGTSTQQPNGTFVCQCETGYAGPNCDLCSNGYHPAGTKCVPNVACQPNTCNGHGSCDDSLGYPICSCYHNFATIGTNSCSICAPGYENYPLCTPVPESVDSDSRCNAQLLPRHLDTVAYLGYDDEARLQGNYYIDVNHKEHDIVFKLNQTSLFRLYAEPHWVDIDLWLYIVTGTKTEQIANGGLAIGKEESLFLTLNNTIGDDHYLLKFRYFVFSTSLPRCETVNIDLAIAPVARSQRRIDAKKDVCHNRLNSVGALPFADKQVVQINSDEGTFTYNPPTKFAVAPSTLPPETRPFKDRGYYFWNKTISLNKVPDNHVAILRVEVGYSFLESDFALLLELGADKPTHCSGESGSASNKACMYGFNIYNKNILETVIRPNSYTLWIYQPERMFGDCALFEFSMSVRFEPEDAKVFLCNGATLPPSLNGVNYINPNNGYLHLAETYWIDFLQYSYFEIKQETYFKLFALPPSSAMNFMVSLFSEEDSTYYVIESDTIYRLLRPGNYSFFISAFSFDAADPCPKVDVELELLPRQMYDAKVLNQGANNPCPFPAQSVMPQLPNPLMDVEYRYNSSTALYAFGVGEVKTYPITVFESMRVIASIESNFLLDDIRLELRQRTASSAIVQSRPDYNRAFLDHVLDPGQYLLSITRPSFSGAPQRPLSCSPFDFSLHMIPSALAPESEEDDMEMRRSLPMEAESVLNLVDIKMEVERGTLSVDQLEETMRRERGWLEAEEEGSSYGVCFGEEFEQLPQTFSSKRFLYSDSAINYQNDKFLVPLEQNILITREITFTILDEPAILRVYTEAYSKVDIDLKLYMAVGLNDTYEQVAAASNGIYGEEVIVAKLLPRVKQGNNSDVVHYKLKVLFWKWNLNNQGGCQTFNMEIAITPASMVGSYGNACPNSGDKWPPSFPQNMPAKSYVYNSLDPLGQNDFEPELLYITQGTKPKSKTYTFQLGPEITDLFLQVGYNFGLGDMAMTLTHKETNDVIYGVNGYNRNYITQYGLLPGTYELKIYEPASNHLDYLLCSYFTFEAFIVQGGKGVVIDSDRPTLPTTLDLNSVSHLFYEGHTHFQSEMTIFEADETVDAKDIVFTVDQPSVLRVACHAVDYLKVEENVTLKLYRPVIPIAVQNNSLYALVNPGESYRLSILRPEDAAPNTDVVKSLQLAVEPMVAMDNYIQRKALALVKCDPFKQHEVLNVTSGHAYTYSKTHTISSAIVDPHLSKVSVTKFKFSVSTRSVVVARVGFQFTLNELHLTLARNNEAGAFEAMYHPRQYKNFNELDLVVEPGTYTLNLALVHPSEVWGKLKRMGDRCVPYSLSIVIDDLANGGAHTDCSAYNPLPQNLDRTNGGSSPYGGPIRNGYIHISDDKFSANALRSSPKASDTMTFTVSEKSVISLFTVVPEDHNFGIKYRLSNKRYGTLVEPFHSIHTRYQRIELFIVDVSSATQFDLTLEYEKDSYTTLKSCPSFGLDLIIDKYYHVLDNLACPNMAGIAPSPQASLTLPAANATISDFVSTNISTNFINSHMSNGKFTYPISISVAGSAYIMANLGYSSLSNAFTFTLKRTGSDLTVGTSSFAMVPQRSGQTNVIQYLSGYLRAGEYTITIEQPTLPFFQAGVHCYPFVWDVLLRTSDITNIVEKIEPSSASQIDPRQQLDIRISFTERPYSDGKPVDINNPKPIKDAFVLRSPATADVHPSFVEPYSSGGTTWLLIFRAGSLKEGHAYTLLLAPNSLRDSKNAPVVMSGREYIYSTISTKCSGHGHYFEGVGCVCVTGYAGAECEKCAPGYVFNGSACVLDRGNSTVCRVDSCGCKKDKNDQCVTPLGSCEDLGNNRFDCICNPAYHVTGDYCERCLPGYYGYPDCQTRDGCNPACSKNAVSCDIENNKCICPANWAGPTCDECAPGYSGPDCSPTSSEQPSGWNTFFKTFSIIVGILIGTSAIGWLVWWRYKIWRSRRPRSYLPLGLEELEGATELRGQGDDGDDDAFADDPMFSTPYANLKEDNDELALEDHPDDDLLPSTITATGSSNGQHGSGDDGADDFNPRADDGSQTTQTTSATSSPSLLDL